MQNIQTKKKGSAALTVFFIIALIMIFATSILTYRGFGTVPLGAVTGTPMFLSVFRLLLGAIFALDIFLIGKLNDKKGVVIPFSIINMFIALVAFLPERSFYLQLRFVPRMMSRDPMSGISLLISFAFIALMLLFTLLTMLAAVKKKRRRPKGLAVLLLITTCLYAFISLVSILYADPLLYGRLGFVGLQGLQKAFRMLSNGGLLGMLFMWKGTLHTLFPFTTLVFFFTMFFAARSISPAAEAAPAFAPVPAFNGFTSGNPAPFAPEPAPVFHAQAPVFQEAPPAPRNQVLPVEPLNESEAAKEKELRDLSRLHRSGTITDADYQLLRQRILNRK